MKKSQVIVFLFVFYLTSIVSVNADSIEAEDFSVDIPHGWKVEREEGKLVFIMPDTACEEIYISISSSITKGGLSLEDAWKKMKPLMIKNVKIIYEGEEEFSNVKWKKLGILESICDKEIKKIILFTLRNKSKYIIQFVGPTEHFKKIFPIFNLLKQSFKLSSPTLPNPRLPQK